MSRVRTILLCAGWAALACVARGADTPATALLPEDSLSAFKLSDNANQYATMSTADVTGQPFSKALRVVVTKAPERSMEVMLAAPVDAAMTDGDVLLISFWMRSGAAGQASVDAGFRPVPGAGGQARPPRGPAGGPPRGPAARGPRAPGAPPPAFFRRFSRPLLTAPADAGTAWKQYQFPLALTRAFGRNEAEVYFTLGLREQTVELGGIELANYKTTRNVADLPFTRLGYEGDAPGAAWRKAAEERIEKYRKGDLTVVVKNAAGEPVRGAQVAVKMRKHAFLWGTAVNASMFSNGRVDAEALAKYKQETVRLFNFSVMENENKWPQWSIEDNRPGTIAVIDWLRQSGVQVRGHNLVWPSWRNTNVQAALDVRDDPAALEKVILDHITETTTELKGRLVDWDVINEPFSNHDLMDILGQHAMVDWFRAAHRGDPNAKLYINDFGILTDDNKEHRDHYAKTIQYLIDQGAPARRHRSAKPLPGAAHVHGRAVQTARPFRGVRQGAGDHGVRHQHLRRSHPGRLHARLYDGRLQLPAGEGVSDVGLLGGRSLEAGRRHAAARLVAQAEQQGLPGPGLQEVVDQRQRHHQRAGYVRDARLPGRLRHRSDRRRQDQDGAGVAFEGRLASGVRAGLSR